MANKLLLIHDVDGLGRSGDVVSVKPGYSRNFLLPQGMAVVAEKHALRMQTRLQEERKKKAIVDLKESEELAIKIEVLTLSTNVKVDHDGHMYGSVSATDIVHILQEQAGITLEKRSIQLKHPLKETGVFTINLKLKEGITTSFKLKVVPEEVEGMPAASVEEQKEE